MSPPFATAQVFLDANAALHIQRADQIDWCNLTGAREVVLLVAPIFLRELEKQKVHNPSRKLRDRAADTIKWLAGLIEAVEPPSVRPGVTMAFVPYEPQIDFAQHRLSKDIYDDFLIASALEYAAASETPVWMATADQGLRVKLRAHKLKALIVPDQFRLPAEPDPLEKELQQLRRENARLQSRLPKLSLVFQSGEQHITVQASSNEDEWAAEQRAKIRAEHSFMQPPNEVPKNLYAGAQMAARFASMGVSKNAIKSYNKKLEAFFVEYNAYLAEIQAQQTQAALTFELNLALVNDGTALANHVDAVLTFPDDLRLLEDQDIPMTPDPPRPSTRPNRFGSLAEMNELVGVNIAKAIPLPSIYPGFDNYEGRPLIDKSRCTVRFTRKAIKHGFSIKFEPLFMNFPDPANVRSVTIDVQISAAELIEPVLQQIHVIVA